ncbi:rho GTPase-activating protein 19-like isoform X2 [Liolophura sinensis]|uniref:rho GTPase-activating protein 19-like isoform X2 n=1 Tax=Liolophura sinensis TaxID=3198878 RepID=UPI0031592254
MSTSTLRRRQTEAEKNVVRLQNIMPDRFISICRMHLSFILDLDGDGLEELLSDSYKDKKKPFTPFSKKKGPEKCVLFGSPLTQDNMAQIYQLIEFLGRATSLETEGLFRKSGNIGRQKVLKERLNNCEDLELDSGDFSPHDCATVLKTYLGELPEPLVTDKHYLAHCQVTELVRENMTSRETSRAKKKQLKALQLLVLLLPRENALLLECLLDLLHKVSVVEKNMMNPKSLGTVFAPHLICPRKLSPVELHAVSSLTADCVSFMIQHAHELFKIPREVAMDVGNFWKEMEDPNRRAMCQLEDLSVLMSASKRKMETSCIKRDSNEVINTIVSFADREKTQEAESSMDTQVALAQLYAHVQSMPESARKRKLLKQFNRANRVGLPSGKHNRSKSFGDALKKHLPGMSKHKRGNSNHDTVFSGSTEWYSTEGINVDALDSADESLFGTPVVRQRTFSDSETSQSSPHIPSPVTRLRFESNGRPKSPRTPATPRVHIVDMSLTPYNRSMRKRRSSESLDEEIILPSKEKRTPNTLGTPKTPNTPAQNTPKAQNRGTSTPEQLPSSENEINYISQQAPSKRTLPTTPNYSIKGRPVALVSPITKSVIKASRSTRRAAMTPRSRAPMALLQYSPITLESSI